MQINWNAIPNKFNWVAMNLNRELYAYHAEPEASDAVWVDGSDIIRKLLKSEMYLGVVPDVFEVNDWRESLMQRPNATLAPVYDPGNDASDPHPAHGMKIMHTFVLREGDLWSLDAWLGPALAIMLEAFLDASEPSTKRDDWHEMMRVVASNLKLMRTSDYYSDSSVSNKAIDAAIQMSEQLGRCWW